MHKLRNLRSAQSCVDTNLKFFLKKNIKNNPNLIFSLYNDVIFLINLILIRR